MNFGTVSGNVSAGKGAVYYNGSGAFEIRNRNQISDNTTPSGKKANVYLAQDKYITVMSDLDTSQKALQQSSFLWHHREGYHPSPVRK